MAEVMHYKDFKEEGSEAACKGAGKYRQQGKINVFFILNDILYLLGKHLLQDIQNVGEQSNHKTKM